MRQRHIGSSETLAPMPGLEAVAVAGAGVQIWRFQTDPCFAEAVRHDAQPLLGRLCALLICADHSIRQQPATLDAKTFRRSWIFGQPNTRSQSFGKRRRAGSQAAHYLTVDPLKDLGDSLVVSFEHIDHPGVAARVVR